VEFLAERVARSLWGSPPTVFYAGLAGSALLETLFPPYPGDTVTVVGGALAGGGKLTPLMVWLSSVAGCFSGTMLLYLVGRGGSRRLLRGRWRVGARQDHLLRVERWMSRWGRLVVFGSRFLPAVRSLVAFGAGTTGMRPPTVALLSLAGIAVWQALLVGGGVVLGSNWQRLSVILLRYSQGVLVLLLTVVVILLVRVSRRRR
jgi:membrane protein DedA with SNARE-associated domain